MGKAEKGMKMHHATITLRAYDGFVKMQQTF